MPSKEKHWEDNNGHIQCINDGRRTGSVSVRYAGYGGWLAKVSGGKLERILENLTSNPIKAVLLGAGCDGCDSVVIGDDRYGCRIC